jgi:hypothetical protein
MMEKAYNRRTLLKQGLVLGSAVLLEMKSIPSAFAGAPRQPQATSPKKPSQFRYSCYADRAQIELVGHGSFTTPFRGFLAVDAASYDPAQGCQMRVRDFYATASGRRTGRMVLAEDNERPSETSRLTPHSRTQPFPAQNEYRANLVAHMPHLAPGTRLRSQGPLRLIADVNRYPPEEQQYQLAEAVGFEDEDDPGPPVVIVRFFPALLRFVGPDAPATPSSPGGVG